MSWQSPRSLLLPSIVLLGFIGLAPVLVQVRRPAAEVRYGAVLHETRSAFSQIRVREKGAVRSLLFVDEDGTEYCQSALDLGSPATLQHGYAKSLFVSLLFREPLDGIPSNRTLIIGLGGGGMVRFLNGFFPDATVEAVEIDPVVVEIAAEYFGVAESPKNQIHTGDAFEFFDASRGAYDTIYLDAFLRAPEVSGLGEKTERLKTRAFLESLRTHLKPGGVVGFNLIYTDPRTESDLEEIRAVFPDLVRFRVPGTGNLVVIGPRDGPAPSTGELIGRGERLDASLNLGFSLASLARERIE